MQKILIFCKRHLHIHASERTNWLQIMRISAILFMGIVLTANLLIASPGHGQGAGDKKISVDYRNASLKTIIRGIEEEADVVIMYEITQKFKDELIDFSIKDKTLTETLDELTKGRNLKWTVKKKIYRITDASET